MQRFIGCAYRRKFFKCNRSLRTRNAYWPMDNIDQPRLFVGAFQLPERPRLRLTILSPLPPLPRLRDWAPSWGPLMLVPPYERAERRLIPRHQILMAGKIVLATGLSVNCTVRNFS